MVVKKTGWLYAMTVTEQYNPNITNHTRWTKPSNAIGNTPNTYAEAVVEKVKFPKSYKTVIKTDKNGRATKQKVIDKYEWHHHTPYTISAHDFRPELPSNAVIKKVTIEANFRTSAKDGGVQVPRCRWNLYGQGYKKGIDDTKKSYSQGWNKGIYYTIKTSHLSSSFTTYTFELDEKNVEKANAKLSDYTDDIFGVDFEFYYAWESEDTHKSAYIQLKWVRCKFEYEVPEPQLKFSNLDYPKLGTSASNPLKVGLTDGFIVTATLSNKTVAPNGTTNVQIDLPWGTTLEDFDASHGTYDPSTSIWTVNLPKKSSRKLDLYLSTNRGAVSELTGSVGDLTTHYYYTSEMDKDREYGEIEITPNDEYHEDYPSCANIYVKGFSSDDTITLNVANVQNIDAQFSWNLTDECINIDSITSSSDYSCTIKLKESGDYQLSLNYCFTPKRLADVDYLEFTVTLGDYQHMYTADAHFDLLPPWVFAITNNVQKDKDILLNPSVITITNHRVLSDLDTNASVIPIVFDSVDSNMIMDACSVAMDRWDELDYIGCIPLEQTHFDPKSTYKDTLIDSRYKNKRYMGKKLASDEDITLNVRLHPHQVTTLQGLIDMDKPIPINANHKCFEGDALNHRGWAEIYAVKTEQTGNNPHWYKCDIDVKYLTHNLDTRFKIDKGKKVDDYVIPSLVRESVKNGDNLSGSDYFLSETDGTFHYQSDYYDEELDQQYEFNDYERNTFNIDNGEYIRIKSINPLTQYSTVHYSWSSTLIAEDRENNIERTVQLVDKDNKVYFRYEYDNLVVDGDEVTANVIYHLREDDELIPYEDEITFRYNPSDVTTEFDEVVVDTDEDIEEIVDDGEAHIGSTLSLTVNGNKLSVIDGGFNGREVSFDVELEEGDYYYEVDWLNNNSDDETSDIDCIIDFQVFDTILTSVYSDKWANLIVSPFPVADKPILFTRKAEEGTIYYYHDDGEEFSYIIEPYYQYANGTDLQNQEGSSIFNLNYGYDIVYIRNGLVSLGFNRLNGQLYLARYDKASESYITIARLHLEKYDDINVNNITDDKIEIQASDSVFTIYRGHPYIKIKHELEDIYLDTQYNTVWSEQVGTADALDLPIYWELMNHKNLLPSPLKPSDFIISESVVNDRADTSLSFDSIASDIETDVPPQVTTGAEVTFTLDSDTLSSYVDYVDLNDTVCSFGEISWSEECGNTPEAIPSVTATNPVLQIGDSTDLYAQVVNGCNKGVEGALVKFYESYTPQLNLTSSASVIQTGDKPSFTASLVDADDGSKVLLQGQTVYFYENYVVSSVSLTAPKNIIQTNDTLVLTATIKDEDGSLIKDETVDFEKIVDSSNWNINVSASKQVIQSGDSSVLTVTVTDANNNAVENVMIDWYIEVDD